MESRSKFYILLFVMVIPYRETKMKGSIAFILKFNSAHIGYLDIQSQLFKKSSEISLKIPRSLNTIEIRNEWYQIYIWLYLFTLLQK